MNADQNKRTFMYLAAAAVAILIAAEPWAWGKPDANAPASETGQKLLPDFDNPLAATSMSIVKYDEDTSTLRMFQIAQVDGRWAIPSHQNYPADAKEHLAQAATALMDLDILSVASDSPGEHEQFGVLDPDAKSLAPGATGVGTRVTMKDAKDSILADLIIGKDDKDNPKLHFVRKAGRDRVYRVAVKTDKLSTRFGDWIEKDLLKLNALDVRSLQLNDYTILQAGNRLGQLKRSEIDVAYDDAKNTWSLESMTEFDQGKPIPSEIGPEEELNTEKLNALKSALDDLQIVDVERKPKGMKGLQLVDDVINDQEALASLERRGFFAVPLADGTFGVYSKEGEVVARMKDGLEYVLRFGQVASTEADKTDAKEKDDKDSSSRVNRYLFVMARFNPEGIAKPELEQLPGDDAAPTEEATDGDKPAADKKPAEKTADELAAEEDAAERKKADAEKRAAAEKENKRKLEDYEERLKKGEDHVVELNNRFADWYYIISDEVYHKIHLGRADVVKAKETKPAAGDTPPGGQIPGLPGLPGFPPPQGPAE